MTGTTTVSGISIAKKDYNDYAVRICLIVSFCFGSFLVGIFTRGDYNVWEVGPEYGQLFFLLSGILIAACVAAYVDHETYLYYYLSAMAMGCQNAITSRYSGSLIRSTHMTGTITDIGLICGQYTRGVTKDLWKLPVLLTLVLSFFIGGVLAVLDEGNKLSLLAAAIFYAILAVCVQFFIAKVRGIGLLSVMLGRWERVNGQIQGEGDSRIQVGEGGAAVANPLHCKVDVSGQILGEGDSRTQVGEGGAAVANPLHCKVEA